MKQLWNKNRIGNLYVGFLFLIYPLLFYHYYFDIVTTKYVVFLVVTCLCIAYFCLEEHMIWKPEFDMTDVFVISFFVINLISVAISPNKLETINGADGRNVGIITVILMTMTYVIIKEHVRISDKLTICIGIGSSIVAILGILHMCNVDILGFYQELEFYQKLSYISTIGHVDIYTSFFALTMPVLYYLYLSKADRKWTIFFFVCLMCNLIGVFAGHCDSAYFIVTVGVLSVFVTCSQKYSMRKAILPLYLMYVINTGLIRLNDMLAQPRIVSTIGRHVFEQRYLWLVTFVFGVILLLDNEQRSELWIRKLRIFHILAIGCVFAGVVCIFGMIYYSVIARNADTGRWFAFLRIQDASGSYRGYIWRIVWREFRNQDLLHQLFGIGTDSLKPYLIHQYGEKMYVVTDAYYDNAHNEFLQYLITNGVLGLVAYLGILIGTLHNLCKYKKNRMWLPVLLAYVVQSSVNLNQVITTPLFFVVLAMANQKDSEAVEE